MAISYRRSLPGLWLTRRAEEVACLPDVKIKTSTRRYGLDMRLMIPSTIWGAVIGDILTWPVCVLMIFAVGTPVGEVLIAIFWNILSCTIVTLPPLWRTWEPIEHHTYASTTKVIWISKSLRDLIRSVTLKFQRTPLVEVLCEYVRITFRVNKFPYFPEKIVKHSYPPQPCAENLE